MYKIIVIESENQFDKRVVPLLSDIELRGEKCECIKACNKRNAEALIKAHADSALIFLPATREMDSYRPFIEFLRDTMHNESVRVILYAEQLEPLMVKTALSWQNVHDFLDTQKVTDEKIITTILSALNCYSTINSLEILIKEMEQKNVLLRRLPSEIDGRQMENNMIQLMGKNNLLELLDEELERLATYDIVTGVFNRKKFENILDIAISHCNRYKNSLSLILLAVNNYVNIVESYGNHTSEDLLEKIVNVIKMKTRKSDVIARWDKDKFIILFPEAKKQETLKYIESLRMTLDSQVALEGKRLNFNFGVTCFEPEDSLTSITKRVEEALYANINACKGNVVE